MSTQKGRPPGVKYGKLFQVRVSEEMQVKINDWRRQQEDIPSMSEAVRRLIEKALSE